MANRRRSKEGELLREVLGELLHDDRGERALLAGRVPLLPPPPLRLLPLGTGLHTISSNDRHATEAWAVCAAWQRSKPAAFSCKEVSNDMMALGSCVWCRCRPLARVIARGARGEGLLACRQGNRAKNTFVLLLDQSLSQPPAWRRTAWEKPVLLRYSAAPHVPRWWHVPP